MHQQLATRPSNLRRAEAGVTGWTFVGEINEAWHFLSAITCSKKAESVTCRLGTWPSKPDRRRFAELVKSGLRHKKRIASDCQTTDWGESRTADPRCCADTAAGIHAAARVTAAAARFYAICSKLALKWPKSPRLESEPPAPPTNVAERPRLASTAKPQTGPICTPQPLRRHLLGPRGGLDFSRGGAARQFAL
jgi:hypothetical protein